MNHNASWSMLSSSTFGQSSLQKAMSYVPSKRQREQDEPTTYNEDLNRGKKKHRSLPLRGSPRSSQRSNFVETVPQITLSALTPVGSSDDEDGLSERSRPGPVALKVQQPLRDFRAPELALDTAMDIDSCEDLVMDRNNNSLLLRPPGFERSNRHPLSAPKSLTAQSLSAGHIVSIPSTSQRLVLPITRTVNAEGSPGPKPESPHDTLWWRSPRLLSPVSDNGDAITGNSDTSGDAEMAYDISLPEFPPLLNSFSMEADAADMRKRLSSLDLPDQGNTEPISRLQPGKKLAFSMGYRADCDKCQRRVPGHYSHIIRG